jgi:hypothetical protein
MQELFRDQSKGKPEPGPGGRWGRPARTHPAPSPSRGAG